MGISRVRAMSYLCIIINDNHAWRITNISRKLFRILKKVGPKPVLPEIHRNCQLKVQTVRVFEELSDGNGDNAAFVAFQQYVFPVTIIFLKESLMLRKGRDSCSSFSSSGILQSDWI